VGPTGPSGPTGADGVTVIDVLPTTTVGFTMIGNGTPATPYVISGDVLDAIYTTDTDIKITDMTKGVILTSPNGTTYRVRVTDLGDLVTQITP
jgi:hypothetical protein